MIFRSINFHVTARLVRAVHVLAALKEDVDGPPSFTIKVGGP
jgi:hypothetical protein